MIDSQGSVECLDIGNTKTKLGVFQKGRITEVVSIDTYEFIKSPSKLLPRNSTCDKRIACCSVVPEAEESLRKFAASLKSSLFMLSCETCAALPISYPFPKEIGPDRLANSIAAHTFHKTPSVVIDFGTATTFDVITKEGGYEGGIIAPGPQGYLDFLHQNTSLLPKVRINLKKQRLQAIGKSTVEAMELGVRFGYGSMVMGILDKLLDSLTESHRHPEIILAGGAVDGVSIPKAIVKPNLTLEGLALAFQKNNCEGLKS